YGFSSGYYGSVSPASNSSGYPYSTILDYGSSSANGPITWSSTLAFKTVPSDPGQSWLTSITCMGVTHTGSTATYSYSSGIPQWVWQSTTPFGFYNAIGTSQSCTIVHR